MSAEALRRAAALIRERVEAATPGPWFVYETKNHRCVGSRELPPRGTGHLVAQAAESQSRRPNADHIASWHPAVALAVADWLDSTAIDVEHVHTPVYNLTSETVARALAVARAYLGEA